MFVSSTCSSYVKTFPNRGTHSCLFIHKVFDGTDTIITNSQAIKVFNQSIVCKDSSNPRKVDKPLIKKWKNHYLSVQAHLHSNDVLKFNFRATTQKGKHQRQCDHPLSSQKTTFVKLPSILWTILLKPSNHFKINLKMKIPANKSTEYITRRDKSWSK